MSMVVKQDTPPDKGMIRVFVYGTLKTKHYNNVLLRNTHARFLGHDSITLMGAQFVDFTGFPGIIHPVSDYKNTQTICGEVWYGNQEMLDTLDVLEGHPTFFERTKTHTNIHNRKVWYYRLPETELEFASDILTDGIWKPQDAEKTFWKNHNKYKKEESK